MATIIKQSTLLLYKGDFWTDNRVFNIGESFHCSFDSRGNLKLFLADGFYTTINKDFVSEIASVQY